MPLRTTATAVPPPNPSTPSDPSTETGSAGFSDFSDIDGFLRIPRVASLTAGPDGRVVAAIQEPDEHGGRLV